MKKLISLALAVFMLLSLATVAFATQGTDVTGSITIKNFVAGNVYSIYKMMDLETYDVANDAYLYKVNSLWADFFKTEDALKYVSVDSKNYVSWIAANDESTAGAFAKIALEYAKKNGIDALQTCDPTTFTGVFSNLELGYYLVDSSMGALCGLTTTNPNSEVEAKNGAPTLDKQVKEDSTDTWETLSNSAGIGETVEFRVLITVQAGAQNYVFHDQLDEGLTLIKPVEGEETPAIYLHHIIDGSATLVPTSYYSIQYDVAHDGKTCDLEIVFTEEFCNHLSDTDTVAIYYKALVNEKASIGHGEDDGDKNTAYLTFGDNHFTSHDTTVTYSYSADIVKTDSSSKLLDGAKFALYHVESGGTPIKFVAIADTSNPVQYRVAMEGEAGAEDFVVVNGYARLVGLDAGAYFLEEVKNPDGYNKLDGRQKFTINTANLVASLKTDENGAVVHDKDGVKVINQKGNKLPETGAMGRTIFISFGMVVMIGTGLLLVTKKRMSMIQD